MQYNDIRISKLRAASAAALALVAGIANLPMDAWSAPFQGGNLVVYNVGAEKGAKAVSLAEYRADGTRLQAISLSAANGNSLTSSSTGSEGLLTRSANGQCLAVPGYAAAPGDTPVLKASTALAAQRVLALVGADGSVGNFRRLGAQAFDGDSIRSAASSDCVDAWASGKAAVPKGGVDFGGIWFAGANPLQLAPGNMQGLAVTGQLFVSIAGGGTLNQIGTGLPTSGLPAALPIAGLASDNFRGIAFVRLQPASVGADTLYVAANSAGTIQKYVRNGDAWEARGTVALAGVHGLVAMPTGEGNAMIFATDGNGALNRLFDTSGAQGVLNGAPVVVATPAAKEMFYGVALAPEASAPPGVPGAPSAAALSDVTGSSATLRWAAPASGPAPAFYVVEVSGDNFVSASQSLVATTTQVALTQLQAGQKARVRAVNSAGGSTSAQTGFIVGGREPPTTSLADGAAYSGVVGSAYNPDITFTVQDALGAAVGMRVSGSPANPQSAVITGAGIQPSIGADGKVTLKLVPSGVGYADIVLTISDAKGASITRTIRYAASANTAATASTRWYQGRSDASSAFMLADGSMVVADDEAPPRDGSANALPGGNALFAYHPQTGGMPVRTLVPDAGLGLGNKANCTEAGAINPGNCKTDGEVDLESSFIVGSRAYILGSHSNSKKGYLRPDRWRLFALDLNSQSTPTTGYYQWLRDDVRAWDAGNAHGLGANYLGLVASSNDGAAEQAPEADTLSGFSIEGSSTSPDDSQMWLGFRAPLVSAPGQPAVKANDASGRSHALIIPVRNYAALAGGSAGTRGQADIGAPIRMDLGGRGIREIRKNASGEYLIIAGPPNSATGTAPRDFRLFSWDGRTRSDGLALNVRLLAADVAAFTPGNSECSAEGIAALPGSLAQGGDATILSDCGDADFYGDGSAAKDLAYATWKKFRSDVVRIAALPLVNLQSTGNAGFSVQGPQAGSFHAVVLPAAAAAPSWEQVRAGTDASGQLAQWVGHTALAANLPVALQATGLASNTAYTVYGVLVDDAGAAGLVAGQKFSTGAPAAAGIDFPAQADRPLGSAPFAVSAGGGMAGVPIAFSSQTPSVCTVTGSVVRLLQVGTCTLRAAQQDNPGVVERSFQVAFPATMGNVLPAGGGTLAQTSAEGWQFATASAGTVSNAGLPALPEGYGFVMPEGLGFILAGGASGSAASVRWQLPLAAPANAQLWKYHATLRQWRNIGGVFAADRSHASFTVTDGGEGDEDGLANGVIVDPVFLVAPTATPISPANAVSVPALSDAGRALLALALAGAAALGMRRRRG